MLFSLTALSFAIAGTALGQFFYKRFFITNRYRNLGLTFACLGSVPLFTMVALRNLSLDTVYVTTSITIGITTLLAVIFLHEKLSKRDLFAIFCIMGGVVVYNLNI